MSQTHIDFDRFAQRGAVLPSAQERAHLDLCAACRQELQLLSQAERALSSDADLPSSAQADAVLQAVLSTSVAASPRPGWLRQLWLPALAAAGVALLVAVPALLVTDDPGTARSAAEKPDYQARGSQQPAEVGVRAYCVSQDSVEPMAHGGPCPQHAKVSVSVFIKPQQPSRALLFLIDSQRQLLRASSDTPQATQRGLPVGVPGADPVIDAYIDLQQATPGQAEVVVALCLDCVAADVEPLLLRAENEAQSHENHALRIERVLIDVVGAVP